MISIILNKTFRLLFHMGVQCCQRHRQNYRSQEGDRLPWKQHESWHRRHCCRIDKMLQIHFICRYHHCVEFYHRATGFPKLWTEGSRSAVFKTGCKLDIGNYRLITVLPIIAKIFETIVCHRFRFPNEAFDKEDKHNGGFLTACRTSDIHPSWSESTPTVHWTISCMFRRYCHGIRSHSSPYFILQSHERWLTWPSLWHIEESLYSEWRIMVELALWSWITLVLTKGGSPSEYYLGSIWLT